MLFWHNSIHGIIQDYAYAEFETPEIAKNVVVQVMQFSFVGAIVLT